MTKLNSLCLILLAVIINSCSTDFDVNAPYKETTVVYGLLNPNDSVQYIKINKAFLGEGNALIMAQQADSINYQPNQLDVKLERYKNGGLQESIQLDTTTTVAKDDGTFSNPYQLLFKTNHPVLKDGSTYKLVVYNKHDQKTISANAFVIQDIYLERPTSSEKINFYNSSAGYKVAWWTSVNGRLYQVTIRFNYKQYNYLTHDTTDKFINLDLSTAKSNTTNGNEKMTSVITGDYFYQSVASNVHVGTNDSLIAGDLDFIIAIGDDVLSTYIEVNQPSIGIIQEKPEYTNIENGIGVFASRWTPDLNDSHYIRPLSFVQGGGLDSLWNGRFTENLPWLHTF